MSIDDQSLASDSSIIQTLIGVIIAVKQSIIKRLTFHTYLNEFSGESGKKNFLDFFYFSYKFVFFYSFKFFIFKFFR